MVYSCSTQYRIHTHGVFRGIQVGLAPLGFITLWGHTGHLSAHTSLLCVFSVRIRTCTNALWEVWCTDTQGKTHKWQKKRSFHLIGEPDAMSRIEKRIVLWFVAEETFTNVCIHTDLHWTHTHKHVVHPHVLKGSFKSPREIFFHKSIKNEDTHMLMHIHTHTGLHWVKIQFPYKDQQVNKSFDFNYCLSAALKNREQRFSRPALTPLFTYFFLSSLEPISSFTLLLLPLCSFPSVLLFKEMDCTKYTRDLVQCKRKKKTNFHYYSS